MITWAATETEIAQCVPTKYYTDLVSVLKSIPASKLADLVGARPKKTYLVNRWREFTECVQVHYQLRLRDSRFEYLCSEWIRRKHYEKPGRKGNKHCGPGTVHLWAVAVCKAYHAVFKTPAVYKSWAFLMPNWTKIQYEVMRAVPLYRSAEHKYWMGECHIIRAWCKWFSYEDCVRITKDFENAVLTPEQYCILIDKFLYETLIREGEALRHVIKGEDDHNRTHIGLYHSNFTTHVYRSLLTHGSRISTDARDTTNSGSWEFSAVTIAKVCGIVGFNDRQKNQSRWLNPTNNKWYLSLDESVPAGWMKTTGCQSLRYLTNRWMLCVLFKSKIAIDATEITIEDPWRPLFPPLSDPESWFNVTKKKIDSIRRVVYKGIVPDFALGLVSGHCWRGGQLAARATLHSSRAIIQDRPQCT